MKIIKHGKNFKAVQKEKEYELICIACGCVFSITQDEVNINFYGKGTYPCPCCNKNTFVDFFESKITYDFKYDFKNSNYDSIDKYNKKFMKCFY
jgi:hypothetical protein